MVVSMYNVFIKAGTLLQVASRALNLPISKIHVSETSTNLVPNTTMTSGSSGSDLNGWAVIVSSVLPGK